MDFRGTAIHVVWSCRRPFPQFPKPEPLPSSLCFNGLQKKCIRYASAVIANEQQLFQYIDFGGAHDVAFGSSLDFTFATLGSSDHVGLSSQ